MNFQWVGWPGIFPENDNEKQVIQELLATQKCYPIWLTRDQIQKNQLFNERFLRPLFHNFKGTDENELDDNNSELWHSYCDLNTKFVQALLQIQQPKAMVWIHDVQLLLAPIYLRRQHLNANIGFYFHSPFPSTDIFKTFQYRLEILKSLLCCDLIGFHLFEFARNFYTSTSKILHLQAVNKKGGFIGIEYHGRTVLLRINHIGIDQEAISGMLKSQNFLNFKYLLSQQIQFKKVIIGSVDRLHPISGIKSKLEGYQHFLKNYPPFRKNTILIQYLTPGKLEDINLKEEESKNGVK